MYMLEILSAVFSLSYFVLIHYLLYYFGGVNIFCILHILKMLWQYFNSNVMPVKQLELVCVP